MGEVSRVDGLPREYQEIYDELVMPVDTNIKLESVILSDDNQRKVNMFLEELKYRDKFVEYGLDVMNRLLFYGASGCGKTFLAKALSNHLGYYMLYIDIAKALTDDTVSKNLSDIFKLANYMGNSVVFLDECDSIAWARDSGNSDGGTIRRATNSLFQQLDQMNVDNIFISATNMLHRLDPAFERRFNMKLEFRRPQLNISECISRFILPKFLVDDDVDITTREIIERRAKQNAKLSYYEIEGIVNRAMKRSIMNDTSIVRTSDIYNDLALAMNVKLQFDTGDDKEEIFHNNYTTGR